VCECAYVEAIVRTSKVTMALLMWQEERMEGRYRAGSI